MRIKIELSPNTTLVPYDYQSILVSRIHDWFGKENKFHNSLSSYSFSWFMNGNGTSKGINFNRGTYFIFSSYDSSVVKKLITGVQSNPEFGFGMFINSIQILEHIPFEDNAQYRFIAASPIFLKRSTSEKNYKYFYYKDQESSELLRENLLFKLNKLNLPTDDSLKINFDNTFSNPRIKGFIHKGIRIKGSSCPVLISGKASTVEFAYEAGIGNSTGMGFGLLELR